MYGHHLTCTSRYIASTKMNASRYWVTRRLKIFVVLSGELPVQKHHDGATVRDWIRGKTIRQCRCRRIGIRPELDPYGIAGIVPRWRRRQSGLTERQFGTVKPLSILVS